MSGNRGVVLIIAVLLLLLLPQARADDILNVELVGTLSMSDAPGKLLGMAYDGNGVVYIAADHAGLIVMDVSDPEWPVELANLDIDFDLTDVCVCDNYAFVAHECGLSVIDITDPANPDLLSTLDIESESFGLCLCGEYGYLANEDYGLTVVDLIEPEYPGVVVHLDDWVGGTDARVVDDYLYVVASPYLRVFDLTMPDMPDWVAEAVAMIWPQHLCASGDMVYLTGHVQYPYPDGLVVVDISNPSAPQQRGTYEVDEITFDNIIADTDGEYVYLSAGQNGMHVLDVSDPDNPEAVGWYIYDDDDWKFYGLTVGDGYIYAWHDYNFAVYHFSSAAVADPEVGMPVTFTLAPVYPNPFNANCLLNFSLPTPAPVTLRVVDLHGREVQRLIHRTLPAGEHGAAFSGAGLASGTYYAVLTMGGESIVRPMTLLK